MTYLRIIRRFKVLRPAFSRRQFIGSKADSRITKLPASLSLLLDSRGFLVILFQALNNVGGQISGQDPLNMAFVTTLELRDLLGTAQWGLLDLTYFNG